MDEPQAEKPKIAAPEPAEIEITADGQTHRLGYEKAFVLGCALLEAGKVKAASQVFNRLEAFVDRGPRAFIMHAFCECEAHNFDECKKRLEAAFEGDQKDIAATLHDAFVSCHVGIRKEGLKAIAELIDKHENLPTLCLLLGNMLESPEDLPLAKRCWSLAVNRDRPGGAVASSAMNHLRRLADE